MVVSNLNAVDNNKSLPYYLKTMSNLFKGFSSNLIELLLGKLLDPSNRYNLESLFFYYSNFAIYEVFHIKSTSEGKFFKAMENNEISEACGIDNFSVSHGIFLNSCKVAKLKQIFKKGKKIDPSNYRSVSLPPLILKIIEKVVHYQKNELHSGKKILYNYQSRFLDQCIQ